MFIGKRIWRGINVLFTPLLPEHESAIKAVSHRAWVGGEWDEIGQLQFDFLVSRDLRPNHVLLDIACGSLRAGRLLIPYLEAGSYLGTEKHVALVDEGLREEIDQAVVEQKRPEFVISSDFEFRKVSKKPDFCIEQSIFTHLNPKAINLRLDNLSRYASSGCRMLATFLIKATASQLSSLLSQPRWVRLYVSTNVVLRKA